MGLFDSNKTKEKGSLEEVTQSALEKGGVLALMFFDAHGNNSEEVEGLLVNMGQKIAQEQGVIYAVTEIDRAMEMEDKLFSSAAQVRVLVASFTSLVRLCAMYGPMGVEVMKPNELKLDPGELHELLLLVSEMSHEFTTTMMMKIMKPEEREAFGEKMKRRAEMGKKLMDESEKEEKK